MLVTSFLFQRLSETTLFHRHIRRFFSDYGMPISLIAASGMAYWGRFNASNPTTLPVGGAFQAANGRTWIVKFWELDGKWVCVALPFGIILWILLFFDHNVSVCMSQCLHTDVQAHCSIVSDSTGFAVSFAEATRLPLRLLPSWHHDIHSRTHWGACAQRAYTASTYSHRLVGYYGKAFPERLR
jgi:hypothetical protein